MFFKIVVKIFENLTRKHLYWSLLLINFITNRLQHRFFLMKFAKFLRTSFYRTPPVAASAFCKDFLDISYENFHTHTLMCLQLIYFLNTISFWLVEFLFLINETLKLADYFQSVTEFTLRFFTA